MNPDLDDPPASGSADSVKKVRDWMTFTHLSGLCCLMGIPSFLGPLVCWLIKKEEMSEVDRAGREALNFQITMSIIQIVSVPLMFVIVGIVTLMASAILTIVFSIIAGVEANKGVEYRYPMSYRFIK